MPFALSLRDRVDSEVRTQAAGQAAMVAATAGDLLAPRWHEALARLVHAAATNARGRVIIVDARGRVIVDSAARAVTGASFADRPEIAMALRGRHAQVRRRSASLGTDLLATAAPIARGGRIRGAARITQSVAAVSAATRRVVAELALVGTAVLALALLAGALLAVHLARPLRRLEAAAGAVAAGDLTTRAAEEGSAEQRSVARSFNEMTRRLERLLRSQQQFVADASHQLRTPLTGLRLRLEEAREAPSRASAAHELDAATMEVDRLAQTVEELLVLSRAGERDRPADAVDLLAVAEAAAERVRPMATAQDVALAVVADGDELGAVCPRVDLDRALDALVENALDYGRRGGVVEIAAARGRIEVRDRGPGPAPGEGEAMFERFRRGRAASADRTGGTGLGLPIARELARAWGGDATLAARPGGGALATLTIPSVRGRDAGQARRREAVTT